MFNIAIGIPSLNEAENIARVVKNVDKGLQKYFPDKKTVIINTDGGSTDGTRDIFLSTPTKTEKICVSIPPKNSGKGRGVFNFLKKMYKLGAKAGMITDADIKSGTPEWVKLLAGGALKNCGLVVPVYKRKKEDGTITNHVCYPFVYGVLGKNIRQPIGGDFGFSSKFAKYLLNQKWPKSAYGFGVDIFMTTCAIEGGFKICQANLGKKTHKPSAPKLNKMSLEVIETLFNQLSAVKKIWLKEKSTTNDSINEWTKKAYDIFYEYDTGKNKKEAVKKMAKEYFSHSKKFAKETKDLSEKEFEKKIIDQAKNFRKHRGYLLSKYKISS